jgi:signal transduction histidine kinase/ligand-binding sensor domain-containing protein
MNNKMALIVFALSAWSMPFFTSAQDIHFEPVPGYSEQSNSSVFSMAQDNNGFLWLGTAADGLIKYNGYQYTVFSHQESNPNTISNDRVECVMADKEGNIWIGHYHNTSGLDRLDPSTGIFTHFHHSANDPFSLASDTINAILQDHEGTVWLGTLQGLDRYDSKTNKFYHYHHNENDPGSLSSNQVRVIYEDKKGTIWVGTGNTFVSENIRKEGGLNKFDRKTGKFTRFLHKENDPYSLVDNRVGAIFEDSRGNFWVGTAGDGLHSMDREKGTFVRHTYDPKNPGGISRPPVQFSSLAKTGADDHISFITEDIKGRLWIGTFGGINVYDPATNTTSFYGSGKNSKENLDVDYFWASCKTRDGLMWISTYAFPFYKINPYHQGKLSYTHVGLRAWHFADDNSNGLWIATNRGLIHRDSSGIIQRLLIDKNPSSDKNGINFIEKDDNGRLWLAANHGIYFFEPSLNKILAYPLKNSDLNDTLTDYISVVRGSIDNKIWIAGGRGLMSLDPKTDKLVTYKNDPKDTNSISSGYFNSIAAETNEYLWLGIGSGLDRLDKRTGRFKHYIKLLTVFDILEDSKANLWACTFRGLFKYDKNADIFKPFVDPSGLLEAGKPVWGIAEDHQHGLLLNMSKGLLWLNEETAESRLFGRSQGVNGFVTANYLCTRQNGDVLLGDSAGYFSFSASQFGQDHSHPIANINSFLLNDIAVEPAPHGILSAPMAQSGEVRLNHDQNTFSFMFSGVDFISNHEDARLLYMLQNYDKSWRVSKEGQEAYYFNIPPGNYVFRVKAYGENGRFDEKQVTVTIAPPWWTSWWAYVLYGLCLVGAIFVTDRIRRKVVIEKERAKTRERELAQAKEIEKAYNELKTTQGQLIQSEKMASLGELTAGIAHEIQNPLNFVNNFSEVNEELLNEMKEEMEKGNLTEAKKMVHTVIDNEQKIKHHGSRADAIVKNMLQHAQSTPGHKELADINALTDEYLRLAYHGLRAKDKEFNANVQTHFDPSIGKINIIPQDIGRVLLNLNNNAFYAVSEKKKENPAGYEPTVSVSTSRVNGKVEIRVRDNGKGIPEKIKEKIFQPFFTTKPAGQGTGLGLSLSYDIVKAHGGEISLINSDGQFTEFAVQLPVA